MRNRSPLRRCRLRLAPAIGVPRRCPRIHPAVTPASRWKRSEQVAAWTTAPPDRASRAQLSGPWQIARRDTVIGERAAALTHPACYTGTLGAVRPRRWRPGGPKRMSQQVDPSHIMQVGMGFWASKTLLSAVELELFTKLGSDGMTGSQIAETLELHGRAIPDFPDALVALELLEREGEGNDALYRNTPATAVFLDKTSPAYIGGILEMSNARLYRFWGDLTEALQTGTPQNEIKHTGKPMFEELYSDPARLEQFLNAMAGISLGNFHALAEKFDFSRYSTLCDVGGATGQLCMVVANRHPHMRCTSFDLPVVEPIARRTIEAAGLSERVTAVGGDFFADPLPGADVITMGLT